MSSVQLIDQSSYAEIRNRNLRGTAYKRSIPEASYRYYRRAKVWCYTHKKFEHLMKWANHNPKNEFASIQNTLLPSMLTMKIGNLENMVLLEHGMCCPDMYFPPSLENAIRDATMILLRKKGIEIIK